MQCIKGTFHPGQKLVTLARNMKVGSLTVRLTPAQVYKTFWHEAVHSILYENGYTSANDDEKLVDVLAVGIVEVIKSGKYED
jgi:hypothetical protein